MVIKILALLTVVAQASFVLILGVALFRDKLPRPYAMLARWAVPSAFAMVLAATSGSLYLSEIAGFRPCDLCWYQRIFMYPQVALLGLAWLRREDAIIDYCLALLGMGLAVSLYHNYIVYQAVTATFCAADGKVSCTQQYIVEFGYVTIPMMALTAFAAALALLLLRKYAKADN